MAQHTLIPVLQKWYPIIVAELPVPGYTPPNHFSIIFDKKYQGRSRYQRNVHSGRPGLVPQGA